jgi:hypothetical protein
MSLYISRIGRIVFSQQELSALNDVLKSGDRAGFYLAYYGMTDSHGALLQSKVATFGEAVGGAAFAANRFLQDEYTSGQTPYPGIYVLSQQVARSAYNAIARDATTGGGAGKIDDDAFLASANAAWAAADLLHLFPGNILFGQYQNLSTPGAYYAAAATAYAPYLGKSRSDFSGATIVSLGGGMSAAVDEAGRTQAVFGTMWADVQVHVAAALLSFTAEPITLDMLFGGSMPSSSADQAAIRVGFNEGHPGYNGDVGPTKPNLEYGALDYRARTSGSSQRDLIFASGSASGGEENDIIIGQVSGQVLAGDGGDDIVWGRGGVDQIDGGRANDVLRGGAGNDELKGGQGRRSSSRSEAAHRTAKHHLAVTCINSRARLRAKRPLRSAFSLRKKHARLFRPLVADTRHAWPSGSADAGWSESIDVYNSSGPMQSSFARWTNAIYRFTNGGVEDSRKR